MSYAELVCFLATNSANFHEFFVGLVVSPLHPEASGPRLRTKIGLPGCLRRRRACPAPYNVFFKNSTPSGLWFNVNAFLVWKFDPFRVISCLL